MIYDDVMRELQSRSSYKYEIYAPYYVCSYATHVFNLFNQKYKVYWESKKLPNMRLHLLFVAPPGYMKTFYLSTMGGDTYGIFRHAGVDVGSEQSMTEAAFVGTISNISGVPMKTEGAAETFRHGLLLVDEFSAVTNALKAQYNTQLDAQLLAALDHGYVNKRLASGKIEYTTNLTLWAGVQPAKYDLSSGMGRRLCFLLFLPTRYDNEVLLRTMHGARNIRPELTMMDALWEKTKKFKESLSIIEHIEFGDDVLKKYLDLKIFSYEGSYFDRLILGYYLARYGPDRKITVHIKDREIIEMIEREKEWRDSIGLGIDQVQLEKIIEAFGGEIDRRTLAEEALLVGWNAKQVMSMVEEMRACGIVKYGKGSTIVLIKSIKEAILEQEV